MSQNPDKSLITTPIGRRHFMALSAGIAGASFCLNTVSQEKQVMSSGSSHPKFDAHFHALGPKADLMPVLNTLGVERALTLSYAGFFEPAELADYEKKLREDIENYPGRFRFASSFSVKHSETQDYAKNVIAKLKRDFDAYHAVAVKIWKDMGMMLRDEKGGYVFCDDARFLPIYDYITERRRVIYMHIADPLAAWLPLDPKSPHYNYYHKHPEFHWYGHTDRPHHDEILRHRDALVARYPKTLFVAAHLASQEHDLKQVAAFLDNYPNAYVDTAARVPDLRSKPDEEVRAFFIKYQDRILYGSDWEYDETTFGGNAKEKEQKTTKLIEGFQRVFSYFEETLALPEEVLRKFYFTNADTLLAESS